jgi:predicted nucleotidyltransferase
MLTENDIRRIADKVVRGCSPLAVGTFGSYATGSARDRSDLDLFLIKQTRDHRAGRIVRRVLFDVIHPIDAHVFTPEEFEDTVYEELSFTWVIARQARLYYWTQEAANLVPSLASRVLNHK